jgi:putative FmdB family regulatory protein
MPIYSYMCGAGHRQEVFTPIAHHRATMECHSCGTMALQVIEAPMLVKIAADVCYDSPIDGRPITTQQARQEDLKRNNCSPYDPEQKTDYHRRIKQSEAELDKSIETHVEESIEKMSGRKRAELYSELTEQGKALEIVRSTYVQP